MKQLNERERKRRKFLKIYKSVENKLHGENIIWWNALSRKARYHFVFRWSNFLFVSKKANEPKYKCEFKYFLKEYKKLYNPNLANRRTSILNYLLNSENK